MQVLMGSGQDTCKIGHSGMPLSWSGPSEKATPSYYAIADNLADFKRISFLREELTEVLGLAIALNFKTKL